MSVIERVLAEGYDLTQARVGGGTDTCYRCFLNHYSLMG